MTSSPEKPVVVLVHGTWQTPFHFLPLILRLRQEGFPVAAPRNATAAGWEASVVAEKSLEDDVEVVKKEIQPHLDAGKEIILVGHSYGSLPAMDCVPENSVEERKAKGLKGGVKAVLHISAIVNLEAGLGITENIGLVPGGSDKYDPPPTWWAMDGKGLANCIPSEHPEKYLYSDVDPVLASIATGALSGLSAATFAGKSKYSCADAKVPQTL